MVKAFKPRPFRAREFTVRLREGDVYYKLFKILFLKDGGVGVAFPYLQTSGGLLSIGRLRAGLHDSQDVDLAEAGKVTSHNVKYTHHRNGEAHFSQDGKIYTAIRRESVPIARWAGHIATVQLQGIHAFDQEQGSAPAAPLDSPVRRRNLDIRWTRDPSPALKVVLRGYTKPSLRRYTSGKAVGPLVPTPDHTIATLLSAPKRTVSSSTYLLLTSKGIPLLDESGEPCVTFIGGFDADSVARDAQVDTHFLALSYPAQDFESLRARIGSIDYPNDAT